MLLQPNRKGMLLLLGGMLLCCAGSPALGQNFRSSELNVQYHRAETAWRSGASLLEAKARVDRVLTALPDDAEALKLRAQVLMSMERPSEALLDARRAVELLPKDGEARLVLCEAARLNGNTKEAEAALAAAAELVLDSAELHVRLSWNAVLLGQLDVAESFARIAHALDPNDTAAYYQLARVFILKQQPEDAATILKKGLDASLLDPDVLLGDTVLIRLARHPSIQPLLGES